MGSNFVPFRGRSLDLEAHRRAKALASQKGRDLTWRVTRAQYLRACELVSQLEGVPEGSDRHLAIVDELKSIPGYPRDAHEVRDTIRFVITDSTPVTIGR